MDTADCHPERNNSVTEHAPEPGTNPTAPVSTPTMLRIRLGLAAAFCLILAYQFRISLDTINMQTQWSNYVPFLLAPFSDRIESSDRHSAWESGDGIPDYKRSFEIRYRDQLLKANDKPIMGFSTYLRELRRILRQPPPSPPNWKNQLFMATIRASDDSVHHVVISFPHCTCGAPTTTEATTVWLIPPVFCATLGFLGALRRPRSPLAWAFLALMLSLSQLRLWPEWVSGFQWTATPMAWDDASRVPSIFYRTLVFHWWPAALLMGGAHFLAHRPRLRYWTWIVAGTFAGYALLRAMLEVAWSEYYRPFAALNHLLEYTSTERTVFAFAAIALLAWCWNRHAGGAIGVVAAVAAANLYTSPTGLTRGNWFRYADDTLRYVATVPPFHRAAAMVILLFAVGAIIITIIAVGHHVRRMELIALVLFLPFTFEAAGSFGHFWYPLGFHISRFWPWFILATAGTGLLLMAHSLNQRHQVPVDVPRDLEPLCHPQLAPDVPRRRK